VIQRSVTLHNSTGLHARPAALLVKAAGHYPCTVTVVHGEKSVSAKSLLALLSLGAKQGATITIKADGDQAEAAVTALVALIDSGFSH